MPETWTFAFVFGGVDIWFLAFILVAVAVV